MSIESASYIDSDVIRATINGKTLNIPDDMANRHRRKLAEWEAQGNTISPVAVDISAERSAARRELLTKLAAVEASIVGGYTEGERASWDRKLAEARSILAGETDPARYPIIAAEIGMSGADAATIAQTIVGKAAQFEVVSGVISGARQKGEAEIEAAVDSETARAVPQAVIDQVKAALSG